MDGNGFQEIRGARRVGSSAAQALPGATWQGCQVHLQRNLLGHSPVRERKAVADSAKRVFHAADVSESRRQRDCFVETFAKTAPKAVACLEDAFDDAMAVMCLPEKYRKRFRSTNMRTPQRRDPAQRARRSRVSQRRVSPAFDRGAACGASRDLAGARLSRLYGYMTLTRFGGLVVRPLGYVLFNHRSSRSSSLWITRIAWITAPLRDLLAIERLLRFKRDRALVAQRRMQSFSIVPCLDVLVNRCARFFARIPSCTMD